MPEQLKHSKFEIWQPVILAIVAILGMVAGSKLNDTAKIPLIQKVEGESELGIGRIEEIIRFIENKYVDEIESDSILELAIKAVVGSLDPHSVYIPPDRLDEVNEQMQGSFTGLGMETLWIKDTLAITSTELDGPANIAGLQKFDRILRIDTHLIANKGFSNEDIKHLLKRNKGETVRLEIYQKQLGIIEQIKVHVGEIDIKSADIGFLLDDQTGYIKIKRFSADTYKDFMKTLESLVKDEKLKNLIIDVRDNPGGFLPETTKILSQLFSEKDRLLVYTQGKNERATEFNSTGRNFFDIEQIAVLINENSASGSEIIAGAIQDWDRGVVIGRRSFGKGLVQEQYPLSNGGAIRLTVSKYYTPSGRCIQRSYNDKQEYSNDIPDRIENGEMFAEQKSEINDSTVFYTKLLNRKVFGGGGIYPDVFVSADSLHYSKCYHAIIAGIPQIAFLYYEENLSTIPQDEKTFISKFEVSEKRILDYFENEEFSCANGWKQDKAFKKRIQRQIKNRLARLAFGEKLQSEFACEEDKIVLKAREMLSNSIIAALEKVNN